MAEKQFKVRMMAFMTEVGQDPVIRIVSVPEADVERAGNITNLLNTIYHNGQNDFQRQPDRCSVSVGDVIEIEDQLFIVKNLGFSKMSQEKFEEYGKIERRDRMIRMFGEY